MNELFENRFAIRRVMKDSDDDYIKALSIYNSITPIDIKTSTNELTRWLAKQNKTSEFEMLMFILYLDNDVIGLAMLCYIPKQRIVVYDYIALNDAYRLNAVFFTYISLLQNYIRINSYDVSYYVVEISNKNNGKSVDKESRLFKKLICLEGFGMVNAKYLTLPLGNENFESSFEANLYIKTNDDIETISKDTFLNIVHAIYYKYYLTWYSPILVEEELIAYKQKIDDCYDYIEKQISTDISLDVTHAHCPLSGDNQEDKTYGYLPSKKKKTYWKYPFGIAMVIMGTIFYIWVSNYILNLLNMPIDLISSSISGISGVTMTSVLVYMKKS